MTRIGRIGTGVMGSSKCGHLLRAGHDITVSTRTRERAELHRMVTPFEVPTAA